jgi:hypothetical protein
MTTKLYLMRRADGTESLHTKAQALGIVKRFQARPFFHVTPAEYRSRITSLCAVRPDGTCSLAPIVQEAARA